MTPGEQPGRARDDDRNWRAATDDQYRNDANLAARQAVFAHLVEADPLPAPLGDFGAVAGNTVLDVGCGNGQYLRAAASAGAAVIGTDLSVGMLEAAAATTPGAALFRANAERLPVADDSVDVALALWMLYHVADKPAAVGELRRVTRPDGYVVATTNTGRRSFLDDLVTGSLEAVLDRPVDAWFPPLGFTAENGEAILGTAFTRIETHHIGNRFEFTDPQVVVRYVASMMDAITGEVGPLDQAALLAEVGRRTEAGIAQSGSIELTQRRAVFICRG